MPDLVVPSAFLPRRRSVRASIASWYGMTRWALPLMRRREQSMPLDSSLSTSARSTDGSTTTPFPITGVMWS